MQESYWVVKFPDESFQNWEKGENSTTLLPEAGKYDSEEEAQAAADILNKDVCEDNEATVKKISDD